MRKSERILKAFCNYLIDNKVVLNDSDEDYFGQNVANVYLSDVLKDTDIDVMKLTVKDIGCLNLSEFEVYRDNHEDYGAFYGEVFSTAVYVSDDDVVVAIWDGCA